jgi:hypothetical protein
MTNTIQTSYSAFTLDYIRKQFSIAISMQTFFPAVEPVIPSQLLVATLQRTENLILASEKARSEFLVAPILLEVRAHLDNSINIYSGIRLDVAPEQGLQGICDFLISKTPPTPTLQAPLLVLVEAKKNDIDEGLGQCAGEMLAALRFNQAEGVANDIVYGCVTTGELWQFLRLQDTQLIIDPHRLYIESIDKILGMLIKMLS